jgi:hypothetical protein
LTLDDVPQVLDEVEAVGDLASLRRPLRRADGVEGRGDPG